MDTEISQSLYYFPDVALRNYYKLEAIYSLQIERPEFEIGMSWTTLILEGLRKKTFFDVSMSSVLPSELLGELPRLYPCDYIASSFSVFTVY